MTKLLKTVMPVALTLGVVLLAALTLQHLWHYYRDEPWTRDAHVSADVVQISPDVSGLVAQVLVGDNQPVEAGQLLFVIDQQRYRIALEQAEAALAEQQAALEQLRREAARDRRLSDLIAHEDAEVRLSQLQKTQAAEQAAQAAVELARLNLARTEVRSPVSGRLNDRAIRLGDYVTTGKPVMAVLDHASFRIDAYFEETRLRHVRSGQVVDIHLMGEDRALRGHVASIAAGIADRNRSNSDNLLPDINPTFEWVRLAQRIPVRIAIDEIPEGVRLIAGRTATVSIHDEAGDRAAHAPTGAAS